MVLSVFTIALKTEQVNAAGIDIQQTFEIQKSVTDEQSKTFDFKFNLGEFKEEYESESETETEEEVEDRSNFISIKEEEFIRIGFEERLNPINQDIERLQEMIYSDESERLKNKLLSEIDDIEGELKECPLTFSTIEESLNLARNKIMLYENMISRADEKIKNFTVDNTMDMSKTVGFSKSEFKQVLYKLKDNNEEMLIPENLINKLVEGVVGKDVNEVFAIAVMANETGWFTSNLAKDYNNFGGMLRSAGNPYKFSTKEEGITATVDCIKSNMSHGSTVFEINRTYCEPEDKNGDGRIEGDSERYGWSYKVLSIMKQIAEVEIGV